ncbi:MAG: putative short-chain dehydrogenase/reductase [Nocardia sp.]|uniref:SDR family NAD(P)-dependent oxidoreductase n=1 Tax=Nocardia sp. TaxID=1821 RepID=UPI002626242C|nr:SDR family NAD(P)-dependent oxidoreductase [Nocardia sp.]MCU1647218.1 putative short-chain dehydrogenase/reductase [Nocardia sp.]
MSNYPQRSVAGRRVVVTGATNGIGKEIARALVRKGASVTILARSATKAEATVNALADEDGAVAAPEVVLADLSDLGSVRAAAAEIGRRYDRIDVLVNNAGIHSIPPDTTDDGYELMMATNHLGPFLLTNSLLPQLESGAEPRIVMTASEAHRMWPRVDLADFAEPNEYGPVGSLFAYARSKLMNILFTQELARRLAPTALTANSFCPGMVASGLTRDSGILTGATQALSRTPLIRTPKQGAAMGIRLVLDESLADTTGRFFSSTPGANLLPAVRIRKDEQLQRRAWDRTAELVGIASSAH